MKKLQRIKSYKGEKTVKFFLYRQGEGKRGKIPAEIRICNTGVTIRVEGYGDQGTQDGYGSPILIEHYDGKLMVRLWSDINEGDPTHAVSLEGAREDQRNDDCCETCGRKKKTFMHNCPKSSQMPEIYGCPQCDDVCVQCG